MTQTIAYNLPDPNLHVDRKKVLLRWWGSFISSSIGNETCISNLVPLNRNCFVLNVHIYIYIYVCVCVYISHSYYSEQHTYPQEKG